MTSGEKKPTAEREHAQSLYSRHLIQIKVIRSHAGFLYGEIKRCAEYRES